MVRRVVATVPHPRVHERRPPPPARPMHTPRRGRDLFRRAILVLACVTAGCSGDGSDGGATGGATPPPTAPPAAANQITLAVQCEVEPATGALACRAPDRAAAHAHQATGDALPPVADAVAQTAIRGPMARLLGRNGRVANDVFTIDLALQSLLADQPMGTPDGTTVTGITVVLTAPPSNGVLLENADGVGTFTAAGQQFMRYPELLSPQQTTGARSWRFRLNGATAFSMQLGLVAQVPRPATLAAVPTGTMEILVSGGLLPPTGYELVIDERLSRTILRLPTQVMVTDVPVGDRTVRLSNLAAGCQVAPNPRPVPVTAGATARTTFEVQCLTVRAGTIVVAVASTGADLPTGYSVSAGVGSLRSVAANGTATFTGIAVGTTTVSLDGVPPHCQVAGGTTRSVTIPPNQPDLTVPVAYAVSCSRAPIATTSAATAVGDTIFTANLSVNSRGAPTTYTLEVIDEDGRSTTSRPGTLPGDTITRNLSAPVTFVYPGTVYRYRVQATNANGSSTGLLVSARTGPGTPPRIVSASLPASATGALGTTVRLTGSISFEDTERDIVRLRYTGIENFRSSVVDADLRGRRSGTVTFGADQQSCTPAQGQRSCIVSGAFSISLEDKGGNRSAENWTFRYTVTFQ